MMREFLLGFIRIQILHRAAQGPVYGTAIIKELREHGYQVSPGTLYPTLHGLAESGYLRRTEHVVDGKVRKYYQLTPAGATVLAEAKARVQDLVGTILTGV